MRSILQRKMWLLALLPGMWLAQTFTCSPGYWDGFVVIDDGWCCGGGYVIIDDDDDDWDDFFDDLEDIFD